MFPSKSVNKTESVGSFPYESAKNVIYVGKVKNIFSFLYAYDSSKNADCQPRRNLWFTMRREILKNFADRTKKVLTTWDGHGIIVERFESAEK